jgi:hypothetical protein
VRSLWSVALVVLASTAICQIRPLKRPEAATKDYALAGGRIHVWVDPAQWTPMSQAESVIKLGSEMGVGVEITYSPAPSDSVSVKRAVYEKIKAIDPNGEELRSEARTPNGSEVICADFRYVEGGSPQIVFGAYYGGPEGTVRMEAKQVLHMPNINRRAFDQLVSGFQAGGAQKK